MIKNFPAPLGALLVLAFCAPAAAQKLPEDCSSVAAPTRVLEASVLGVRFSPQIASLRSAGSVTSGEEEFDSFRLSLRSAASAMAPQEVDVTVIVYKGESLEGKVFRRLATKDFKKQPSASTQQNELQVQGSSFKNRPAQVDSNHVGQLASMRLEFGQRAAGTIPGNLYLCVPKGQTTTFNKTPSAETSYAIGTFKARFEQ